MLSGGADAPLPAEHRDVLVRSDLLRDLREELVDDLLPAMRCSRLAAGTTLFPPS